MDHKTLSRYLNIPESSVNKFMSMSSREILENAEYRELLGSIDRDTLEATLQDARETYEKYLPPFVETVERKYKLGTTPMSPYTLGNWVVGALQFPDYTDSILEMHTRVPGHVFVNELQSLMDILEHMPNAHAEWQRALCLFSLPLMRS